MSDRQAMHDSRESLSELKFVAPLTIILLPSFCIHKGKKASSISTIDAASPQKSLKINGGPIDRVRYQQRFTIQEDALNVIDENLNFPYRVFLQDSPTERHQSCISVQNPVGPCKMLLRLSFRMHI